MSTQPRILPNILAKPASSGAGQARPDEAISPTKRKRPVVPLACGACRKRKTKCDGVRPVCRPCEQRRIECIYDYAEDLSAPQRGKRANERLSQVNNSLQSVLEVLHQGNESDALSILRSLRNAVTVDQFVANVLDHTVLLSSDGKESQTEDEGDLQHPGSTRILDQGLAQSTIEKQVEPLTSTESTASPKFPGADDSRSRNHALRQPFYDTRPHRLRDARFVHGRNDSTSPEILPISQWTTISGTDKQFTELLLLLWTWDTSFTRVVDRDTFEQDLKNGAYETERNSPLRQFCSTFLINAMLGYACVFVDDEHMLNDSSEYSTRGREYIACAQAEIEEKMKEPSYDLLTGLVMLYAYESRIGIGARARDYLEMVLKTYKLLDWDESEVMREIESSNLHKSRVAQAKVKMAWGLYILDWSFSHTYGTRKRLEKPDMPKIWQEQSSTINSPNAPEYYWCDWSRSASVPQKAFYQEVFDAECSLIEIAEEVLLFLYPNEARQPEYVAPANHALKLYNSLQDWRMWFMDLVPDDARELPQSLHVVSCHEILVVIVLRKVAHLTEKQFGGGGGGGGVAPLLACHRYTSSLMSLVCHSRTLYSARYEFWAIQACSTVSFTTLFSLDADPLLHESFEKSCKILWEMTQVYPIAADFLLTLRTMVSRHDIKVSKAATRYMSMVNHKRHNDLSTEWRTSILLATSEGTRGGLLDISLGELSEGFSTFKLS